MFLLDTDTLSNIVSPRPSTSLLARLATTALDRQFTSSITLGELLYGAHRLGPEGGAALRRRLQTSALANMNILPFDAHAARYYGEIRAELERQGIPIGDADTRIAAIALSRDLTVVTGNVRHFERVPDLRVENWLV